MAFEFDPAQPLAREVRRVFREQLHGASAQLREHYDADPEAAVHSARKHFKRLRAMLRLVRGPLGPALHRQEDRILQQCGRLLASARDAHVTQKTLAALHKKRPDLSENLVTAAQASLEIRAAAVGRLDRETVAEVVLRLVDLESHLSEWPLADKQDWQLVKNGLRWVYRQGRQAMALAYAEPVPEHFHDWRKRVKDLWHHLELLSPTWPAVFVPLTEQAHQLSDYLGDEHDLSVLADLVPELVPVTLAGESGALLAALTEEREALRLLARPLGLRLYAESSRSFVRRLKHYREAAAQPAVQLLHSA